MLGLDDLRWFVVFNGIADRWLWGFDADGWRLVYNDPALGYLGILATNDGPPPTIGDARWLADALAFDHDAPVGISPAYEGIWPNATTKDPDGRPAIQPIGAYDEGLVKEYWDSLNMAYGAAAGLRFSGSYVIRYDEEERAPGTDFSERFLGREEWVGLYAMGARQPDPLAEYLCLYRVLEAADKANGKAFAGSTLDLIASHDFGDLTVIVDPLDRTAVNAFEVYRDRAQQELGRLAAAGITDLPDYLYRIRNALAHGRDQVLTARHVDRSLKAGQALPIVKLLARIAIDR